ncbi:MAG: glycosyltransferase, partial [Lachnospiraceae bacterium]|nr:glycosyltransferase [Lachnospiraceae bacterium]
MISIIITYYSGINILKSNIQLLDKTVNIDAEIIIVNDNPSNKLNEQELSNLTDIPIKIVPMLENKGYAAACNLGVTESSGDLLLFLDCDIFVTNSWIQKMYSTLNKISN